jgi:hypothetical protein
MKDTTGLSVFALIQAAASSSADPPISPIKIIPVYNELHESKAFTFSLRVLGKQFKDINEIGSVKRISSNSNAS